jgi:hypothetical protein
MSDPMTNVQIEDVLSSIRRLVAEGDKSRDAAVSLNKGSVAPKSSISDRLVLTEALRVSNDDEAPFAKQESAPKTAPKLDAAARANLESTIEALEAAVTAQSDEWEPDGSEPTVEPVKPTATAFVLKNVIEDAVEIVFDDDDDDGNETVAEAAPVDAPNAETASPSFRHFNRDALIREETPLHAMELPEPAVQVEFPAEAEVEATYQDDLVEDEKKDPLIDEQLNAFLSDEAMLADAGLDETILRKMIVEIIREELQGALGERITRSVRKLVRREISRVVATQDAE